MELTKVYLSDTNKATWDKWISQVPEASYYHSWDWLNFSSQLFDIKKHLSFFLLDERKKPIAVCPLVLSLDRKENTLTLSFSGAPGGALALNELHYVE